MVDPITGINAAVELVKGIRSLIDRTGDAAAKNHIADLLNSLADVRLEVARLKEENQLLRTQNRDLQLQTKLQPEVHHRGQALYYAKPGADQSSGPHCQACYALTAKLIPLTKVSDLGAQVAIGGNHTCPKCGQVFSIET